MPDPDQKWQRGLEVVAPSADRTAETMSIDYAGCQFADRCPHAMEICKEAPPLYQTSSKSRRFMPSLQRTLDELTSAFVAPENVLDVESTKIKCQ